GLRLVGAGDGVPGTVQISVRVAAQLHAQLTGGRHPLDGRGDLAGDDVHIGAVGQQQAEAPLRYGPAADHDDPAAGEAETGQVVLVTGLLVIWGIRHNVRA